MAIKVYRYDGPEVNLGSFGLVRPGDILAMAPKEYEGITDAKGNTTDERFTELSEDDAQRSDIESAQQRETNQQTLAELREEAARWGVEASGCFSKQEIRSRINQAIETQLAAPEQPTEQTADSAPEPSEPAEQAESEEPKRKRKR